MHVRALARRLHFPPSMASKLVTCPDSAHLEMIVYEDTPLGMLVEACTRFDVGCPMSCPRTCAARLDQRTREEAALEVGDTTTFELRLPEFR